MAAKATKADVDDFVAERTWAVVGVSRQPKKFGSVVFRELRDKGYRLVPVNPNMQEMGGEPCYPSLLAIPDAIDRVVVIVPPAQTEGVVREAHARGMNRVWMQPGAESVAAVDYCREHGMKVVTGECILMHSDPAGLPHRMHRGFRRLIGRMPK